uniref:Putative secreted protein n=1 Tax=Anopheles darlingi TaxID=43151 RepID=A0A2M4DCT5_ANODA
MPTGCCCPLAAAAAGAAVAGAASSRTPGGRTAPLSPLPSPCGRSWAPAGPVPWHRPSARRQSSLCAY